MVEFRGVGGGKEIVIDNGKRNVVWVIGVEIRREGVYRGKRRGFGMEIVIRRGGFGDRVVECWVEWWDREGVIEFVKEMGG